MKKQDLIHWAVVLLIVIVVVHLSNSRSVRRGTLLGTLLGK